MTGESQEQAQRELKSQSAAYKEYAENQLVVDQLRVHQEMAKPYFDFSKWLLLINGGAFAGAIAQTKELVAILGQRAFVFVLVVLGLSALCGLFARLSESRAAGMIAIQVAMFEALEKFAIRHATKLDELRAMAARENLRFDETSANPDVDTITRPIRYPNKWWVKFTYGSVSEERHADCPLILRHIAMQAFSSNLQLFFLLLAVGIAAMFAVGNI